MKRTRLTANFLRSIILYDPETGIFTWKVRSDVGKQWNTKFAGKRAGHLHEGYFVISVLGCSYEAHRLAWLYMTGEWPAHEIDHENRDGIDNKWSNLRPASHGENMLNKSLTLANKSGFKGVSFNKPRNKWRAQIKLNGRSRHLGHFSDPEAASAAYQAASLDLHGEFGRAQ